MIKPQHKMIAASIMAIALSACSPQQSQQQNTQSDGATVTENDMAQTESQRIEQFFEDAFEQDLKRSPMSQSYLGYKWDYDKWDDVSLAMADERKKIRETRLAELATFDLDKLTAQQRMSHLIMNLALQRESANDAFRYHPYVMHQFSGIHTQVPSFLINIHRVADTKDAQDYIARLNGVATLFEQIIYICQKCLYICKI